jgi:hypothetical protein
MPEGVGYGPQNTASVGKELNIIGEHAYAYNVQIVNNETVNLFEFTTGGYYLVGSVQGGRNMKSSGEGQFYIDLNEINAFYSKWDDGSGSTLVIPMVSPLPIVIAPYTKVKIYVETNASDTISLVLTGKIYK